MFQRERQTRYVVAGGLAALALHAAAGAAIADGPVELQKLFPDPGPFASGAVQFGAPIALDGDTMAVGDLFNNGAGDGAGAVIVFERDAQGVWSQSTVLLPDDITPGDGVGFVALGGDTLVLTASSKTVDGRMRAGKAYVFERDGSGSWIQSTTLDPVGVSDRPADLQGIEFGAALAFDGQTIAVGAPGDDELQTNGGAVYLFARDGDGWTQTAKLLPVLNAGGFGRAALDIDGDVLVTGGSGANSQSGTLSGAALIFERDQSGSWVRQPFIIPPAPAGFLSFGTSVAVSGDTVVIGAINLGASLGLNDDPGRAFFYQRNPDTGVWELKQSVIDSQADGGDFFGASVDIQGDTAAVGSIFADGVQIQTGAAFIFERDGSGMWSETSRLTASDGQDQDRFFEVALDGDSLAVGAVEATNPDVPGALGAVYVFGPEPSACPADLNDDGTVDANDFFDYLDLFSSGDPAADLTGQGGDPDGMLDADDFFQFLNLFAAGCP